MRRHELHRFGGLVMKPVKVPWVRRGIIAVIIVSLIVNFFPPASSEAVVKGDGLLLYGEGTVQTPRYRSWTNASNTFGSEQSMASFGDTIHGIQTAASPTRDEAISAITSQALFSNQLKVYTWNGSSWTLGFQATVGYNSSAPRYDVVYDELTGKGFVVYSANAGTTNEIKYRTWDGSTWSAELSLDASRTSGTVGWIKALTRPGTDEIAVVWADDSNMDLSGNYFDMSAGTWSGEPAAALSTNIARNGGGTSVNSDFADLAFENVSGDLQVCWGDEDVADLKCTTRTAGTGGSWGTVQTYTSFAVNPTDMKMASEPGTDYIAYNNAQDDDTTRSAEAGIWDGSTWGNITNYDTSINSTNASATNVSVGWVSSGGQSRVVATYDDSLSASIDWATFNKNTTTWTVETDISTSPAPGSFDDYMHQMRQNPHNSSELMFFMRDTNHDLFAKKITFDGSTVSWASVEGGSVLETDMQSPSTSYGWSSDFAYYRYVNAIDGTAGTTAIGHAGTSPNTVYTSDQTGYAFYTDSGGGCAYSKTTNAGTTWASAVAVAPNACHHIAVWYDKWTPGDTGTYIHMVTTDPTSDDLKYNRLDTSSDTLLSGSTPTAITSAPGPSLTNTFNTDDNYPGITKSTDGTIYTGVHDGSGGSDQSYIIKCSSSCDTASNWSDTSIDLQEDPVTGGKNNSLILLPQQDGDIMAIVGDTVNDDVVEKIYDAGTSAWAGSWTTIDANAVANPTHAGSGVSAVLDKITYDVYLAYVADAGSAGTNDDIRTSKYSGGTWTAGTDAITNATKGIITTQISFNENNKDVYVAYIAQTTPGVTTTANVYWKKSTGGLSSWGSEQMPINSIPGETYGLRLSPTSTERIYATWTVAATTGTSPRPLFGDTIADLSPPTLTQSAFRVFANSDSTDVGSALAAQDTAASLTSVGDAFRLRMLMHLAGSETRSDLGNFKLQYVGKGSGTCAAPSGGTPASYTDVTAATAISYKNNATPADGASLTSNANDPTHSGHTIRNQTYEELNPFTNSVASIASGEDGKWDFALYDNGAPASTAYCFRIVKNDSTVLDTYSQYPQVTTGASNVAPNSASSLAQKKTDDTVLNTGDWTNESSVKFTASVSDPDSSDTLQLCVEKKPLGVSFTNTEDSCGTGVAYSGTPVTASVTIGSHSEDEYHWQARVKDAGGLYSAWVSYGGNAESARDYGVDTTAPTGGTVYDGTNAGVDAAFNDNSLSSLSGNWSGFSGSLSGIARYDYSMGTTPGGTDIKTWTNNNTTTSVTATGLTLRTSAPYYVNVRAVDNAGNTGSTVSSDGQLVLPSLSFGLSASSIAFANLNAANSYTDTETTTLTTSTNAYGGYLVRAYASGLLTSGSFTIPAFAGGSYAAPDSWQGGDLGFGYTSDDTLVQGANIFQSATCPGGSALAAPGCYAPFSLTAPGDIVADHTTNVTGTAITNETFTITYRVTTSSSQAARRYNTNIVYSVVPIY